MACRFRRKESAASGFRRIAREETAVAVSLLADRGNHLATRIHEARRHIKRLRALLHLARHSLDPAVFTAEDTLLRAAARRLSTTRDADAALGAFSGLKAQGKEGEALQRHLAQSAKRARRAATPARLARIAGIVRKSGLRIADASLQASGWALLEPGFADSFRSARKRWRQLGDTPAAEELHRWRRSLKRLCHQLALIQHLLPKAGRKRIKDLDHLAEILGDHHDLTLLELALQDPARKGGEVQEMELMQPLIDGRREVLLRRARKLGEACFRGTTKATLRRLHRGWKAARHDK